jgi:hypothetical protein
MSYPWGYGRNGLYLIRNQQVAGSIPAGGSISFFAVLQARFIRARKSPWERVPVAAPSKAPAGGHRSRRNPPVTAQPSVVSRGGLAALPPPKRLSPRFRRGDGWQLWTRAGPARRLWNSALKFGSRSVRRQQPVTQHAGLPQPPRRRRGARNSACCRCRGIACAARPPEMPQDGGPTLPREPQAELRMNPGHDSAGEAFRCRHAAANVQVMRPLRSAKRTTSPVLCRFNFSIRLPR